MTNDIIFSNKQYPITKSLVAIYKEDDSFLLELSAFTSPKGRGISLSFIEIPLFRSIDLLDGQVIHVDYDNNKFADDTLGTDIESFGWFCETNNFIAENNEKWDVYNYYDIRILFTLIHKNHFRITIDLQVCPCSKKMENASKNDLLECKCCFETDILDYEPYIGIHSVNND